MNRGPLTALAVAAVLLGAQFYLWARADRPTMGEFPGTLGRSAATLSRTGIASSLLFALLGATGRHVGSWASFESDVAEVIDQRSGTLGWIDEHGITVLFVATAMWFVSLVSRRRWRVLSFVAATLAGGYLLLAVVKASTDMVRPGDADALGLRASWEFPSGHSFGATLVAALVVECDERLQHLSVSLRRIAVAVVSIAAGALRLMVGEHYLGDVIAAAALAMAWFALCSSARYVRAMPTAARTSTCP